MKILNHKKYWLINASLLSCSSRGICFIKKKKCKQIKIKLDNWKNGTNVKKIDMANNTLKQRTKFKTYTKIEETNIRVKYKNKKYATIKYITNKKKNRIFFEEKS